MGRIWNCFHRSISTLEKKCTFSFSKRKDHNISICWVKTFHYLKSSSAMYIETGNQRNFKDYISSKVISSLFHDVMCSSWKKKKEWITKEGGRITKRVGCYVASSAVVFIKKLCIRTMSWIVNSWTIKPVRNSGLGVIHKEHICQGINMIKGRLHFNFLI